MFPFSWWRTLKKRQNRRNFNMTAHLSTSSNTEQLSIQIQSLHHSFKNTTFITSGKKHSASAKIIEVVAMNWSHWKIHHLWNADTQIITYIFWFKASGNGQHFLMFCMILCSKWVIWVQLNNLLFLKLNKTLWTSLRITRTQIIINEVVIYTETVCVSYPNSPSLCSVFVPFSKCLWVLCSPVLKIL